MIKKIKDFINAVKINNKLKEDIASLLEQIDELEDKIGDPVKVVEQVLERGINWYDSNQLETEEQRERYQKQAQDILDNEVFKNEANAIISDCVEYCAKESKNHEKTIGARMTINGIEVLRKRIEDINLGSVNKKIKLDRVDDLYNEHFN